MRLLAVVLLACLLVTGAVSAVSMNVGSAAAVKTIAPSSSQKVPASAMTGVIVTQPGRGMLEVYSVPSGATVTLDGNTNPGDKTPIKYSLFAGSHTVVISLEGYQDYTEIFTLDTGAVRDINADLKMKIQVSAQSAAGVSEKDWITVNIDAFPPNATVTQARSGKVFGKTPLSLHLSPDTYYVIISSPLYQDQTIMFNRSGDIMVTLKRTDTGPALAGAVPATTGTLWWGSGIAPVNPELSAVTTVTPLPTTPMAFIQCPQDWSCLTPAEAQQQFGTYARLGDIPCGIENIPGSQWGMAAIQYCFRDAPLGSLPQGALAASGIKEGDNIYIMNDTWIEHAVVNKSAVARTGGESTNPFQSFLDFISGIVSGSAKPESRLEIVGFNPCPEPPGIPADPLRLK